VKTFTNTIAKRGVSIYQEQHQGRFKNTKKNTKKFKATKNKTICNTIEKEGGGLIH
jgi:hypothetical protein